MIVVGRYQIGEKLGQGGMGTVYKAFDPLIERIVAVKVISTQLDTQPDQRERFFREARAAGQLSHRNIITIYDLGEQDGLPFLAMEYLEGRDLEGRLRSGPAMGARHALAVLIDVCEGLAHAHAMGIVHRDIKPGNIFLTQAGVVKLLDFGLARVVTSDLTRSNMMIGTMNYMAPEQVRAEKTDHRADIFSLGVVAYELLSGRRAFQADSFAATMYKILQEVPEPLVAIDPTLPRPLGAIVERAMAKDRDARYQTVAEILADFRLVADSLRGSDPRPIEGDATQWLAGTGARTSSVLTGQGPVPALSVPSDAPTVASAPAAPTPSRPAVGPVPSRRREASRESVTEARTTETPSPVAGAVAGPSARRLGRPAVAAAIVAVAGMAAWVFLGPGRASEAPESPPARSTAVTAPAVSEPAPAMPTANAPGSAPPSAPATAVPPPPERDAATAAGPTVTAATGARDDPERARTVQKVASGMRQARRSMEAGNVREAAQAASGVLAVEPGNREATALLRQLAALGRKAADEAESVAGAARAAAIAAGARELAPQVFDTASREEAAARELRGRDDFAAAGARFYEASATFRRAETDARAEADRRAARAQSAAASAPPPVAPPPPAAPPAPVSAPPATALRGPGPEAAAALLHRYEAALEARSLPALKAIWPGLGGAALAAIQSEFQNSRSIEVGLPSPRIEITGTSARVTVRRQYQLQTRDGQRLATETQSILALRAQGDEWVIEDIRHVPVR